MPHVLDDPAGEALRGPHRSFALTAGGAVRYDPEVGPFAGRPWSPADWDDLALLPTPLVVFGAGIAVPAGWEQLDGMTALQMVWPGGETATAGTDVLTADDLDAMTDLVDRTRPGPWRARTHELGAYRGVHRDGRLVAMAGQRMHPDGWVEVSAVCTDPAYRGQRLAATVVSAVLADVAADGNRGCLHVLATNDAAVRAYRAIGFTDRTEVGFHVVRPRG